VKVEEESASGQDDSLLYVPKLGDSKLKDMTWSLDISKNADANRTK
jgi:hypothetical protein